MIIATCYQYGTTDTVTAKNGADTGGNYAMSNCMSANLTSRGRNTTPSDFYGMSFNLAANVTICGAELVNSTLTGAENARIVVFSDAGSTTVYNTTDILFPVPAAYTSHAYLEDAPSRQNAIVGIDYAGAGPSLTGSLATVSARQVDVQFLDKATSRTYWELGFLGLATNGTTITAPSSIGIKRVALRYGWGWRSEVHWTALPITEATRLESLKAATHDGSLPCFAFPYPGTRNSSGVMVDPDRSFETLVTPAHRGGLVRLLDFGYETTIELTAGASAAYVSGASLTIESWQEVPAGEGA